MPSTDTTTSPGPDDQVPVKFGLLTGLLLLVGTMLTNFKASSASDAEKDAQIADLHAKLDSEDTTLADVQAHLATAAANQVTPLPNATASQMTDLIGQLNAVLTLPAASPAAPATPAPGVADTAPQPPAPASPAAEANTRTDSTIGAGVQTGQPLTAADLGVTDGLGVTQVAQPTVHNGGDATPGGAPPPANLPPANTPGGSVS